MNFKQLNLHHLRYFLTIAEEGSLTKAAEKLLIGQPALSAQLKNFENFLGFVLFERKGRGLQLSTEGEFVLKYAKAIKQVEEELISNLGHANDPGSKELVLGAQESVPKSVSAKVISTILSFPQYKLKVIEGTGEELFDLLINRKIDFFLGNMKPLDSSKEILYHSLGKEELSIYASKKFAYLKKNFPHSLSKLKFVLPGFQNPLRHDFEKFMYSHGLHFEVAVEAQDIALLKELAIKGEGPIVLGEISAKQWVESGRLIRIGLIPKVYEQYWLGMVKNKIDTQMQKQIISCF